MVDRMFIQSQIDDDEDLLNKYQSELKKSLLKDQYWGDNLYYVDMTRYQRLYEKEKRPSMKRRYAKVIKWMKSNKKGWETEMLRRSIAELKADLSANRAELLKLRTAPKVSPWSNGSRGGQTTTEPQVLGLTTTEPVPVPEIVPGIPATKGYVNPTKAGISGDIEYAGIALLVVIIYLIYR